MNYKKVDNNINKWKQSWESMFPVFLLIVLVVSGYCKIVSWSILVPFTVFFCLKRNLIMSVRLHYLDYSFLLIGVSEIMALIFSYYLPKSVDYFLYFSGALVIWFFLRSCIIQQNQIKIIVFSLLFISIVVAVITLSCYFKHRDRFFNLGFDDLTAVRQYYRPLGVLSNDWTALLLYMLPAPLSILFRSNNRVLKVICLISFVFVNVSILTCYSRGGYLSLFLFYLTLLVIMAIFHRKMLIKYAGISILSIIISMCIMLPDRKPVLSTMEMNRTTVQSRSTEGRFSKWKESFALFKSKPYTGYGSGNYQMASSLHGNKNYDTLSFRSTNSYLQILVEKGAIGGACYFIGIIAVIIAAFSSAKISIDSIPFISAIVSLFSHEFFFSSVPENFYLLLLTVILLYMIYYPISYEKE